MVRLREFSLVPGVALPAGPGSCAPGLETPFPTAPSGLDTACENL
jgi:hypothetical protein